MSTVDERYCPCDLCATKRGEKPFEYVVTGYEAAEVVPESAHALTVRSVDGNPSQFIAEIDGREVGKMSISVLPLVHDMEIPASPIQRKIADALFFYASGKVKAAGFSEAAVFVADENTAMQRYVGQRAIAEPKSAIFMMEVK